jgi:hypothetical protein
VRCNHFVPHKDFELSTRSRRSTKYPRTCGEIVSNACRFVCRRSHWGTELEAQLTPDLEPAIDALCYATPSIGED